MKTCMIYLQNANGFIKKRKRYVYLRKEMKSLTIKQISEPLCGK